MNRLLIAALMMLFVCGSAIAQTATPSAPSDPLAEARALLNKGEIEKGLAALQEIQKTNPDIPGLDRELGVACYRAGDYPRALNYLDKTLSADPNDKEVTQLLGLAYFFTGKAKQAIPLLEKVQSWYPTAHVDASYVLGVSYIQTQDYENARKAFAAMYGVSSDSAASHLFLARMLLRQGHDPIAEQEVKKAIALDPKLPMVHFLLGESYIFKSRIDEAIKELETELAINPGYSPAYYRLADAYTRVLRWDDAEKLLQRSIWLDSTASGPYILMGKVLLKKNEPTLAVRSLKHALSMDPSNFIAHNLLGQAYRAQGNAVQAAKELELAEKLQSEQNRSQPQLQ